ncbi:hypothetical protein PHYBOEH_000370 [Phytophthora boehmeriae]|uniref:Uncharacterized protein n=1 Tax=Phytophthora boehmeriae TaxID=109152 RepID=A0A8T1WXV7_9STRA|nr:hypothetical protein PHYBOEH_000370 [Phytophthora boehmeriae]
MAEYLDADGVPRRSESVTRRMIQRGVCIDNALILSTDEQAHTSVDVRTQDSQAGCRVSTQHDKEADSKRAANAALKHQAKVQKEKWIEEVNQRAMEKMATWQELQQQVKLAFEELVDVTESNTSTSPSKSNTYIDDEGNLRRRISSPSEISHRDPHGFVSVETPQAPAAITADQPQVYC